MKNPFGSKIVLAIADNEKKPKNEKKADLVSVYLATIPSLQKACEELEKAIGTLTDEGVSGDAGAWLEQLREIEVAILESSIEAVRGQGLVPDEEPALDEAPMLEEDEIVVDEGPAPGFADMVSGRAEVPDSLLEE